MVVAAVAVVAAVVVAAAVAVMMEVEEKEEQALVVKVRTIGRYDSVFLNFCETAIWPRRHTMHPNPTVLIWLTEPDTSC